ncbi:hypothetical protein [Dysgonomonas termitidis]|uniref:Transcriptional regulator n=1 Tax=Dysgonomonas termitidis TaxID=1516126 RepID=A0ABV9L1X6_9BACT
MNTKERLIQFLSYLGISQGKFEDSVNLSTGFVNNVGDSIRKKSLDKITDIYPELNTAWLLTGQGEMLKSSANINSIGRDMTGSSIQQGNNNVYGNKVNIADPAAKKIIEGDRIEIEREVYAEDKLLQEINNLKTEIGHLKATIAEKDKRLEDKDRTIDALNRLIDNLSKK